MHHGNNLEAVENFNESIHQSRPDRYGERRARGSGARTVGGPVGEGGRWLVSADCTRLESERRYGGKESAVNEDPTRDDPTGIMAYLQARVSRAQLLKATAVGALVAVVPGTAKAASGKVEYPFFPETTSGRYTSEQVRDIVVALHTMEHLAVTVLGAAVNSSSLNLAGNATLLAIVRAALMEDQLHAELMDAILAPALGIPVGVPAFPDLWLQGTPSQTVTTPFSRIKFTLPDAAILKDQKTFFSTIEGAENIFVGAYVAAVREFAEIGQPMLAKWAAQILGVEAEHRALARTALVLTGDTSKIPPNNKGHETDLFLYVKDAAMALIDLGFLGGSGTELPLLTRSQARLAAGPMAAAVIQRTPNNATSSVLTSVAGLTGARGDLTTIMSGAAETPPGSPTGTGRAVISPDAGLGQICFDITVSGITLPALAAHIHRGTAGIAGPIVVPLTAPDASGMASSCVSADPSLVQDIVANPANYYVNVHTTEFPGGALRGQLG
jgi:hypothetical protein